MCGAPPDVRFTPNSDRESGPPQTAMSALLSKADMCGAVPHVCFEQEAVIRRSGRGSRSPDQFDLARAPGLGEDRFERAVEPPAREPALFRICLDPGGALDVSRLG